MPRIHAALLGLGLLLLTSCSDEAPDAVDAVDPGNASTRTPDVVQTSQVSQDDPASHGGHGDQAGHGDHGDQAGHGGHGGRRGHGGHRHSAVAAKDGQAKSTTPVVAIGKTVPDFSFTSCTDGKTYKLSDLQKNAKSNSSGVVVLTFWCSFCHSCRHVEEALDALALAYEGKVAIIALDASAGETAETVREFLQDKQLTIPVVLDATGHTADLFGSRVTTTTVVIDAKGVLRYRGRFATSGQSLAADALEAVLGDKKVRVTETPLRG